MRFSFFFALEIGKKEIQLLRLLRFVFRLLFLEIQGAISIYVWGVGDRAFAICLLATISPPHSLHSPNPNLSDRSEWN